jgi:L-alanine-DL-glutamate epimerase-like enolase superfamily enzyme
MLRRQFIKTTGAAAAGMGAFNSFSEFSREMIRGRQKEIGIKAVSANFEREPLIRPFGFKGGYMTEIWQTASLLESTSEISKIGICTQNVLWSDAGVFARHSESGGNALMFALTEHAMQILPGRKFFTPVDLLDSVFNEVYDYGKKITSNANLRKTFVLNSMVGIDNAAWLLYAAENNISSFDELIPVPYRPALSIHLNKVASIPLMAYNIPVNEIVAAVESGYFIMKIKIGQPGSQDEMLEKDKARISAIHEAIGRSRTSYTTDSKLPYYFDANGRYEKKETLLRLLDHARKIGAFEQIAIIEEPFPEELEIDISDIPVRIAADESAHTDIDALKRIQMGYSAVALKAIAKTLSMTLKIIKVAYENKIPCFCADLTVNPILVEWNKNVAARLTPFPGIGLGLVETNGHQNYKNWSTMRTYHPFPDAIWANTVKGIFELNEDYYKRSGGIFIQSPHYEEMFRSH